MLHSDIIMVVSAGLEFDEYASICTGMYVLCRALIQG